jgi:hypothetical protein
MKSFKIKVTNLVWLVPMDKDVDTEFTGWRFVTLDANNLIVEADATSTKIAYAPFDAVVWETKVLVMNSSDVILEWDAWTNFAEANKGDAVDLAISWTTQLIDLAHSVTWVLKVDVSTDAWVVWSSKNIRVSIAKTL